MHFRKEQINHVPSLSLRGKNTSANLPRLRCGAMLVDMSTSRHFCLSGKPNHDPHDQGLYFEIHIPFSLRDVSGPTLAANLFFQALSMGCLYPKLDESQTSRFLLLGGGNSCHLQPGNIVRFSHMRVEPNQAQFQNMFLSC